MLMDTIYQSNQSWTLQQESSRPWAFTIARLGFNRSMPRHRPNLRASGCALAILIQAFDRR